MKIRHSYYTVCVRVFVCWCVCYRQNTPSTVDEWFSFYDSRSFCCHSFETNFSILSNAPNSPYRLITQSTLFTIRNIVCPLGNVVNVRQFTLYFSHIDISPINKISFAHFVVNFVLFHFSTIDERHDIRILLHFSVRSIRFNRWYIWPDALEKFTAYIVWFVSVAIKMVSSLAILVKLH